MIKKELKIFRDKYFILKTIAVIIMMFSMVTIISQTKVHSPHQAYADSAVVLNRTKDDYLTLQGLLSEERALVWTFSGSSTTANGGNYSGNKRNYIEVLSSFNATEYGRLNDRMLNMAVGGYTVNDFSYTNAAVHNPDIAYISIGKNDAAYFLSKDGSYHHSGETPSQNMQNPNLLYFINKVETFIDQARTAGALVILGIPNGMEQTFGAQRQHYENFFAPALREIAVRKNVLHIDYLARYLVNTEDADNYWYKPDRMHVNDLGYLVLANTLIADLDLDKNNSVFSTMDYKQQMAKKSAPYFAPLNAQEDTYMTDTDIQSLNSAGYATYKRENLNATMTTSSVEFFGGAATAGVIADSVMERSYYQYLYRNSASYSSAIRAGNSTDLLQMTQNVTPGSVVFYMPEIFDIKSDNIENSLLSFETNLNDIVFTLANVKACKVILLTPFPHINIIKNAELDEYVQIIKSFAEEKGLAMIDFYGYGNALSNKNNNLMRNWTQSNGLPNCVAHLEIAKYIAIFLNREINTVTDVGGETIVLTNPSYSGGQERDNITPVLSHFSGSTDTKRFMVREIEDIYSNESVAYYYIKGNKETRVYSKNGFVAIEHTTTGKYIFRSYIVRGNKKIYFNDVLYEITEIDEIQQGPQYGIATNFSFADYSNILYRNNTHSDDWVPLVNENIVTINSKIRAVELTPALGSKLVGLRPNVSQGALTQNFDTITFTVSTLTKNTYKYRVWLYKSNNTHVELSEKEGIDIEIGQLATTYYFDISQAKSYYNDVTGFSVQIMGSNERIFLHDIGIIEKPNILK